MSSSSVPSSLAYAGKKSLDQILKERMRAKGVIDLTEDDDDDDDYSGGGGSSSSSSSSSSSAKRKRPGSAGSSSSSSAKRSRTGITTTNTAGRCEFVNKHKVFATGGFKRVYEAVYTERPGWSGGGSQIGKRCVMKCFKSGAAYNDFDFDEDLAAIRKAEEIVEAFNEAVPGAKVFMNRADVWTGREVDGSGRRKKWLVEPKISGQFVKFNSNSGHSNGDSLMQALSHFSYHHSKGKLLLCDLQGGKRAGEYHLTDPIVTSRQQGTYGNSDLGLKGMSTFFAEHKCGKHCSKAWQTYYRPERMIPVQEGSLLESPAAGAKPHPREDKQYLDQLHLSLEKSRARKCEEELRRMLEDDY
eukprot:g2302.t1